MGTIRSRETRNFYLFVSPALIGMLVFTLYPIVFSLMLSFSRWDLMSPYEFIGLGNYLRAFASDELFLQSVRVTLRFASLAIPLVTMASFAIALLLNSAVRGIGIYRTIWYYPAITPAVASAVLWTALLHRRFGLVNRLLAVFGITGPNWLWSERWVIPAFVLMELWAAGGAMVIYLAALQGVPADLYDAAKIDGAGRVARFRHITVPMISPAIFFNLVMSLIGMLQYFTNAYVMTAGGPNNASLFYSLYLYRNGFQYLRMGYASALAWILFVATLALTALVFKSSPLWVFYEHEIGAKKRA